MKRTPIGDDNANAPSGMLGIPEGSTWQSGSAPFDDSGAGPAVAAASSVEAAAGAHAASIDLQVAAIPESEASFASPAPAALTDADIVSSWTSPPTQSAEASVTEFGVSAAAQAQEENTVQIDIAAPVHSASGSEAPSFAPVVSASLQFTTVSPALLANHATDSFSAFAPGANVGADAIP
jgi:hypothetical protein